jgi:hypothetical protein
MLAFARFEGGSLLFNNLDSMQCCVVSGLWSFAMQTVLACAKAD